MIVEFLLRKTILIHLNRLNFFKISVVVSFISLIIAVLDLISAFLLQLTINTDATKNVQHNPSEIALFIYNFNLRDLIFLLAAASTLRQLFFYYVTMLCHTFYSRVEKYLRLLLSDKLFLHTGHELSTSRVSYLLSDAIPRICIVMFSLLGFVSSFSQVVLSLSILFSTFFLDSMISFLGLCLFAPAMIIINKKIASLSVQFPNLSRDIQSRFIQSSKNKFFLDICGIGPYERVNIDRLLGKYEKLSIESKRFVTLAGTMPQLFSAYTLCLILILGSFVFHLGHERIITLAILLYRTIQTLGQSWSSLSSLMANKESLYELESEEFLHKTDDTIKTLCKKEEANHAINSIQLLNVKFNYDINKKIILNGIKSQINGDQIALIKGKSGTGKSTLISLISGLLIPTSGQVLINGIEAHTYFKNGRRNLAYVGPEPFLFAGSALDNICLGLEKTDCNFCTIWSEIVALGLNSIIPSIEDLDRVRVSEGGAGLSTGQKQRLSLVRALIRSPSILILDEPTANLDRESESLVLSRLSKMKGKCLLIVITHRPSLDCLADVIINLDKDDIEISKHDLFALL